MIRAPVRVAAPEIVIVWVTRCPGSAPNGVEVSTGAASTGGAGVGVTETPARAAVMATIGAATDSHTLTL
ncbi:hypothetical protein GCM10023176_05460 [Micromonospora coerulea]|uniref:Uncharacterized protein n=1 Tax=Micromonospora coerulea TaxID=47856 RepID=A0ABP8S847_9ACTN